MMPENELQNLLKRLDQIEENQLTILKWLSSLAQSDMLILASLGPSIKADSPIVEATLAVTRQMNTQLTEMVKNYQGQIEVSKTHGY